MLNEFTPKWVCQYCDIDYEDDLEALQEHNQNNHWHTIRWDLERT